MKFKVRVEENANGTFRLAVVNRKGRKWVSDAAFGCPGNAGETAMVLEEYLNNGGKMTDPSKWTEAA